MLYNFVNVCCNCLIAILLAKFINIQISIIYYTIRSIVYGKRGEVKWEINKINEVCSRSLS